MPEIIGFVFFVLNMVLNLLFWAIIISVVASWLIAFNVINPYNPFVNNILNAINRIIEPLCAPIRRLMPDLGGIDISPMIVIILLLGVQNYLLPGLARTLLQALA